MDDEKATERRVPAWLLGRLDPNDPSQIATIVFGQFSDAPLPPKSFWFFVAKNLDMNRTLQQMSSRASEAAVNTHIFSEDTLATARNDSIRLEYLTKFTKKARAAFVLRGCSLWVLNGRYIECGESGGAFRFKNVRGWMVFKHFLNEVPELGIDVDSCYNPNEGKTVSDLLDRKADAAYAELVSREPRTSSKSDKALFAELVSAGLRLITFDQTSQTLRNNDLLANVRSKASVEALEMLLALREEDDNAPSNSANLAIEQEETRLLATDRGAAMETMEAQYLTDSILAKSLEYQVASTAFDSSSGARALIEAELTRDILAAIEDRERILSQLKLESARVQKRTLESDEALAPVMSAAEGADSPSLSSKDDSGQRASLRSSLRSRFSYDSRRTHLMVELGEVMRLLEALREATVVVLESFGAWLRFSKGDQSKRSARTTVKEGTFCVFLGAKGNLLYPASEAMKSRAKKFSRNLEPQKYETIVHYIGVFDSKVEGIRAFEAAYRALPSEQRLHPHLPLPEMLVGQRSCGKHSIIRCADAIVGACEQCKINDMALFSDIARQFVYMGQNYMDKMCRDLGFLDENLLFKRFAPNFPSSNNPLVLPDAATLHSVNSTFEFNSNDPLKDFSNNKERLVNARKTVSSIRSHEAYRLKHPVGEKNAYAAGQVALAATRVKRKQFTMLFDPFPSRKNVIYDALDLFELDRYRPQEIDRRMLRAQHIIYLFCECVKAAYNQEAKVIAATQIASSAASNAVVLEDEMVPVVTEYRMAGMGQSSLQFRANAAFRDNDMFCRSDRGEWASIVNRGRAVRSFEFRNTMKNIGRQLLHQKKSIRATLRRMLLSDMVNFDVSIAQAAVNEAKTIKGGFVDYEIVRVEAFIRARRRFVSAVITLQGLFRIIKIRIAKKRDLMALAARRAKALQLTEASKVTAATLVASCIALGTQNQVRSQVKPIFRFGWNLAGHRCIVGVGLSVRGHSDCENWKIKAYIPTMRRMLILTIDAKALYALFSRVLFSAANYAEAMASAHLIGDSYGALSSLFASDSVSPVDKVSVLFSRIAAANESAILPLLPRIFSELLMNRIDNDRAALDRWEPFDELTTATNKLKAAIARNQFLADVALTSWRSFDSAMERMTSHRDTELEWAQMEQEDIRAQLQRQLEQLAKANERIAAVMASSKEGLHKYEDEVARRKVDGEPSWDGLEQASAWKELNLSRKIQRRFASSLIEHGDRLQKEAGAILAHAVNKNTCAECFDFATKSQEKYNAFQSVMESVEGLSADTRATALEAAKLIGSCYSATRNVLEHDLRVLDWSFVHVREPMQRCQKKHRGNLPLLGHFERDSGLQVDVFFEPLTGYTIVELSEGFELEESLFYDDFDLKRPSLIAAHQRPNEIFIAPVDLLKLMMLHPLWPENLQRGFREDQEEDFQSQKNSYQRILSAFGADPKHPLTAPSYSRQVQQFTQDQDRIVDRLLAMLTTHPFSSRYCIGRLHLYLRGNHLQSELEHTRWHVNVLKRIAQNEVYSFVYPVLGRMRVARVFFDGAEFKLCIVDTRADSAAIAPFSIPLDAVLRSLGQKPLLTVAFVYELITGLFSREVIAHITDLVDTATQDEYRRRWWHAPLALEPTPLVFNENAIDSFRGPVYTTKRIFCGLYFRVEVHRSLKDNLHFAFLPLATESSLGPHYRGASLSLLLTMAEIRAFILTSQESPDIAAFAAHLLHPFHRHELYNFLVDHIALYPETAGNDSHHKPARRVLRREFNLHLNAFARWAKQRLPPDSVNEVLRSCEVARLQGVAAIDSFNNELSAQLQATASGSLVPALYGSCADAISIDGLEGDSAALTLSFTMKTNDRRNRVFLATRFAPVTADASCCERSLMRREEELSDELRLLPVSRDESDADAESASVDQLAPSELPIVHGVFFPCDNYKDPVTLTVSWRQWKDTCIELLGLDMQAEVGRSVLSHSIEYCASHTDSKQPTNNAYADWIAFGTGSTPQSAYAGDYICMLRTDEHREKCLGWLKGYRARQETSRKQEREVIRAHNASYRQSFDNLAALFEPTVYEMVGCIWTSASTLRASVRQSRRLISHFLVSIREQAELIFSIDFLDEVPISALYECLLTFSEKGHDSRSIEMLLDDTPYRSAQLLYIIYNRHINSCTLPLSYCRFPGCCRVRSECTGCALEAAGQALMQAIRAYLCSAECRDCFQRLFLDEEEPGVLASTKEENTLKSEAAKALAAKYRESHRKTVRAEVGSVMGYDEVLPLLDSSTDVDAGAASEAAILNRFEFTPKVDEQAAYLDSIPMRIIDDMYVAGASTVHQHGGHVVRGPFEFAIAGGDDDSDLEKYTWIMERLRVTSLSGTSCYALDRHLASSEVLLNDDTVADLEVLYGVIEGANDKYVRWLPTQSLDSLNSGISVVWKQSSPLIEAYFVFRRGVELESLSRVLRIERNASVWAFADAFMREAPFIVDRLYVRQTCVGVQLRCYRVEDVSSTYSRSTEVGTSHVKINEPVAAGKRRNARVVHQQQRLHNIYFQMLHKK